jgi:endonuclease/exonuclease/phosphatase family metal-dependent hydrolase
MRRMIAAFAALVVICGIPGPVASGAGTATATRVAARLSPPGQISVATINARQNRVLGLKRFEDLFELSRAFRFRPHAFNGGWRGAVFAPDVVAISEFRETNVEIFTRLMKQRFDEPYELVGPTNIQAALLVNTRSVELIGDVQIVEDVCLNDKTSEHPSRNREYPLARLREVSTGAPFTVVGVHLSKNYSSTGISDCKTRNVRALRAAVHGDPGAAFIAGDFNYRPTVEPYECDPHEQSEPTHWWSVMTAGDEEELGRQFIDTVQSFHRERSLSLVDAWTFESTTDATHCNGFHGKRHARIDYIFADDVRIGEAHADHPGWSIPDHHKYSDHRFVLGRFVLSGPDRVARPAAAERADGLIQVTWKPVEGATGYIVYRGRPNAAYATIARPTGEVTTFDDINTTHGVTYRYAIAAVGVDSGEGVESAPIRAEADARGPAVTGIVPASGAEKVSPGVNIRATFNEWVKPSSIGNKTISLYRNGNPVAGRVIRKGGFVIKFDPTFALKKGETYTIVVRPVQDVLGNAGPVFKSRFSTVEPRKKRRR